MTSGVQSVKQLGISVRFRAEDSNYEFEHPPGKSENLKKLRVGGYGGVSLKTRISKKRGKDTCGGIRWDESRGGFD